MKSGFVECGNKCVKGCRKDQEMDQKTCECHCSKTQIEINGICIEKCKTECRQGQIFDVKKLRCVCKDKNYFEFDGKCYKQCSRDQYFDFTKKECKCKKECLVNCNGKCISKEQFKVSDCDPKKCRADQKYDGERLLCVCKKENHVEYNGKCIEVHFKCAPDQVFDLRQLRCTCKKENHYVCNGKCMSVGKFVSLYWPVEFFTQTSFFISECPAYEIFSSDECRCVCMDGHGRDCNGACRPVKFHPPLQAVPTKPCQNKNCEKNEVEIKVKRLPYIEKTCQGERSLNKNSILICKEGYIRDEKTGACVAQCPLNGKIDLLFCNHTS